MECAPDLKRGRPDRVVEHQHESQTDKLTIVYANHLVLCSESCGNSLNSGCPEVAQKSHRSWTPRLEWNI